MDTTTDRDVIQQVHNACNTYYAKWNDANFDNFFGTGAEIKIFHRTSDISKDAMGIVAYYPPQAYSVRDEELCVRIHMFGIEPNSRRQGNGTQFYYRLAQEWFLEGATHLWCYEHEKHTAGNHFWASLGFSVTYKGPGTPGENFRYLEKSLLWQPQLSPSVMM